MSHHQSLSVCRRVRYVRESKEMMLTILHRYCFVLICSFASTFALLCPKQESYEPLDMSRLKAMKGTFYDVTDIPYFPNDIHCWDYHSFVAEEDGFAVNMTQHVEGRTEPNLDVYVHFVPNGDGTYRANKEHMEAYMATSKESISHKATPEMEAKIESTTLLLFSMDASILTDYENYFMLVFCIEETGPLVAIKNKRVYPTGQDTLNFWNEFIKHGDIPKNPVEFKEICVLRNI
uniref:uncharacterized protein LOC120344571 n=1 Tax=Styela clava TaxID=7725 RepID=UPI00193A9335|nr:uncharacterized protein LOC120344571 [Styela clava]